MNEFKEKHVQRVEGAECTHKKRLKGDFIPLVREDASKACRHCHQTASKFRVGHYFVRAGERKATVYSRCSETTMTSMIQYKLSFESGQDIGDPAS